MSTPAVITDFEPWFAVTILMENFSTDKTPADGTYLIRYTDKWRQQDELITAECCKGQFHTNGKEVIKQELFITGFIKMPISVGGAQ